MSRIKGLISAVLPTYNRAHLLEERIAQIRAQTYSGWELIIVNDGSTDKTEEILYQNRYDHRIRTINLPYNSTCVSIPRNIGISWANGEFIAPIDDDNFDFPDKFQNLLEGFNDNAVLSYGNRWEIEHGRERLIPPNPNYNPNFGPGIDNGQILYRAEVYDSVPLIFPLNACDYYTMKHIWQLGKFVHVNRDVCVYSRHKNNRNTVRNFKPIDVKSFLPYFSHRHNYKLSDKVYTIE